jgi:hypothetical protein
MTAPAKNPAAVALGRLGGLVKSERKREAVRKNARMPCHEGKRRGRPRKHPRPEPDNRPATTPATPAPVPEPAENTIGGQNQEGRADGQEEARIAALLKRLNG